jgi:hypothetical protein
MKTNSIFKSLVFLALALTVVFFGALSVLAQEDAPEVPDDIPSIENPLPEDNPLHPIYDNLIGLIGIGGTLALTLTAIFKRIPVLNEFDSRHVSTGAVVLIFVVYVGFYYTGLIEQYPLVIEGLNTVGTGLLALLGTSIAAEFGYRGAKAASVPILGYSQSTPSRPTITHQNSGERYDG